MAGIDTSLPPGLRTVDEALHRTRFRVLPFLGQAWLAGAAVYLGDPGRPYVPKEGLVEVATFDVPDTEGPQVRRTTVWRLP